MLAAFAFPFCFQYLLAAMLAAMLMESFCLLRTGFERVRVFKLPLFLDPGFFEHVAHVWKGKLAKDESEENVSLLSSGAKVFQVVGSWLVFSSRLASASSGRRDTGPSLTTTTGMPSLIFQSTSSKQQLHLVLVGPSQKNWKLSSLVETSSSSSRGSEVFRLRWSGEEVMSHWAWLLGSWVWMCTPWLEGRSWTTRYPWKVWVSRRTALYPSSPGFVVGLVTTCLGSGRVQIASRSVAGKCESSATGVVLLVMLTLSL